MSITPPQYTYEDYKKWQGDWELIGGYPFAMAPSPYGKHQRVMGRLVHLFTEALEECECDPYPELDWIVDEKTVFRPDIAIYCEEIERYPKTTPKLIVEIVSKESVERDEEIKFERYAREGVDYYLLVYPDLGKVRIFRLYGERYKKAYEGDGSFHFDLCDMAIDFKKIFI